MVMAEHSSTAAALSSPLGSARHLFNAEQMKRISAQCGALLMTRLSVLRFELSRHPASKQTQTAALCSLAFGPNQLELVAQLARTQPMHLKCG